MQTQAVPCRTRGRITEIDGLRAYAVLIVVLSHLFAEAIPGGSVGVDVFFVISGFVITGGLLKERAVEGRIKLVAFYKRRMWRLWPGLWAVVAFTMLASLFRGYFMWQAGLTTVLSLMNWSRAFDLGWPSPLDHTWSLSVEEQFYLIWPLFLILLMRLQRFQIAVLIAAILTTVVWRYWLVEHGASVMRIYNGLDTRLDGLLLGCAAAISAATIPYVLAVCWPIPVGWLAYVAIFDHHNHWSYGFTALAAAWLVLATLRKPWLLTGMLNNRIAQWGGARSYSIYLWHFPILYILGRMSLPRTILVVLYFTMSIVAAELSYRYIEHTFRHGWPRDFSNDRTRRFNFLTTGRIL